MGSAGAARRRRRTGVDVGAGVGAGGRHVGAGVGAETAATSAASAPEQATASAPRRRRNGQRRRRGRRRRNGRQRRRERRRRTSAASARASARTSRPRPTRRDVAHAEPAAAREAEDVGLGAAPLSLATSAIASALDVVGDKRAALSLVEMPSRDRAVVGMWFQKSSRHPRRRRVEPVREDVLLGSSHITPASSTDTTTMGERDGAGVGADVGAGVGAASERMSARRWRERRERIGASVARASARVDGASAGVARARTSARAAGPAANLSRTRTRLAECARAHAPPVDIRLVAASKRRSSMRGVGRTWRCGRARPGPSLS